MKYLRRNIFFFFTFYVLRFTFYVPPALAQGAWSSRCAQGDVATIQGLECLFSNLLQVIIGFAGLAFLLMFIKGGFDYLMSDNDDKKVAAAANTLTMAVVGLVGAIISWLILKFISDFTGVTQVLEFKIPGP